MPCSNGRGLKEYFSNILHKNLPGEQTIFIVNLFMTFFIFLTELIVGYRYKSMSLVSDSFHMLSDFSSMGIGLLAIIKANSDRTIENPSNLYYTYGYERFKIMGSFANGILLWAFSLNIIIQSLEKIVEKSPIENPLIVLYTGIVGIVSNFISLIFFHGHLIGHAHNSHYASLDEPQTNLISPLQQNNEIDQNILDTSQEDTIIPLTHKNQRSATYLNIYGVFLHVIGDFFGSIIVIVVASLKMKIKENWIDYLDPGASILLAFIMMIASLRQLRHSFPVFLQRAHSNFNIFIFKKEILKKYPEIIGLHDLHIWQLCGMTHIATVHVKIQDTVDVEETIQKLQIYFRLKGIYSTTIQPEIVSSVDSSISSKHNFKNTCQNVLDDKEIESTCCPHIHQH